ncbi:MAG: sigma-70 family RNA polymerase sigma factor [Clostridia bacterium]|nr:sigma-70 family RNA polymerase sigma factor [Clostridia bacterium]
MMNEKDRIASLVVRLQNGDNSAFDELYKLTCSKVYFVSLKITKNEHDTEDIIQESYVTALKKINTLEKPESFMSWFNQIVANKSKAYLRKATPKFFEDEGYETVEAIPDDRLGFSPEESADKEDLRRSVMEAIDELTEEKRACVMMMYFEEMSVNDISQSLGVPVSTVKNRLWTARKDLKSRFERRGIAAAYSVAPLGLAAWAIEQTANAFSQNFQSGINPSDIISVAAAGTAAAGTGIAAKIAALSTAQKIAAGVAVAGVVAGSTAGITGIVKSINKPTETTTAAYTETVKEIPSEKPVVELVEEVPTPVQIVEKDEENPKHNSIYIQSSANMPSEKFKYAGTAVKGTNLIRFEEGFDYYFCDFYAEETGYYYFGEDDFEWNVYVGTPIDPYGKDGEALPRGIVNRGGGIDYCGESFKGLYYIEKGEWFITVGKEPDLKAESAKIEIAYCGKEITDVEFLNNSLNNRIIDYNLTAPYVTMFSDEYYANVFDIRLKFSSGKELVFDSTELNYYIEGGVKEGENTAVFEFPNQKIEKTLVAHDMTDYVKEIEIEELEDFLKFEINENGFDLNKPEEYTVTVTYGDGTKETFNGADWDKNIVFEDGTVLTVEFTQPDLVDREPVQFIVLIGEKEYIKENCRLTGVDPIGFTKKVIVFSAETLDFYTEMIGKSYEKLFFETENFEDFSLYFPEAIELTFVNSYKGTKRLLGYGLDLFITLIKIASENIIVT